jgi:maltose O-acetyltransferase
MIMKEFILGLIKLTTQFVMWFPCLPLRRLFLKFLGIKIGKDVFLYRNIDIREPKKIKIGDRVKINKKVLLDGRGMLIIGSDVDIAQEANIWSMDHDPHDDYHNGRKAKTIIGDYVWICSRATILPGVEIGRGAVIASGSVVTKDVEPMSIVAGIPAKKIGERKSKLKYKVGRYRPWFE